MLREVIPFVVTGVILAGLSSQSRAAADQKNVWSCGYTDTDIVDVWTVVETSLPAEEVARQLTEASKGQRYRDFEGAYCFAKSNKGEPYASVQEAEAAKARTMQEWATTNRFRRMEWKPNESLGLETTSSRRTKSIFFQDPNTSLAEKGFAGVVFDVEYQFIACSGELHIAYSLVEDSVGIGRLTGGGDRVAVNGGRGRANYWLDGKVYKVDALPEKVMNLPLKGSVWSGHQDQPLGRFADDHAGKALGFGCFSGQTKKIANLDELKNDAGKVPTKDELPKIFEKLRVNFATSEILTSSAAEEEIRNGLAAKGDASGMKQADAGKESGPSDAELRAQQRARREAEFQAKQKAYEEGLAAQQKAVADYEAATQAMKDQQAASAAAARAALDDFSRRQAEYEAQAAASRKAQEDYEATYGQSPQ